MIVTVNIFLKQGVLDPQGKTIQNALHSLNFNTVKDVKVAKQIKIDLDETDKEKAKILVQNMCEEILVNTVIEDYEILI
ncbi:phosphoribosylformylglycinamidine synthase PurLQS, PurS subunit [Campylobacter avium LMG 24591]|uniref:Phosphoribosylformylglycinamidine synthase subunit PurS n=1 Tax=Campylobacter avium LMG 24591 TaxID=522484 RepID=A0A222MYK0_9BACT|nr:phosphoribosylformylglycinamidine synthase subunit PurS [Campylobacter avium]ASQ30676.1 phosphoribosylformylglycinamidine synthase PurLQS, PurS subunit [Campylobacter avium LMG 24591]OYD79772.1 phosphoribosylformylglycinamidine synthase PurLQS, PurS subunit [Campylobacter avium]